MEANKDKEVVEHFQKHGEPVNAEESYLFGVALIKATEKITLMQGPISMPAAEKYLRESLKWLKKCVRDCDEKDCKMEQPPYKALMDHAQDMIADLEKIGVKEPEEKPKIRKTTSTSNKLGSSLATSRPSNSNGDTSTVDPSSQYDASVPNRRVVRMNLTIFRDVPASTESLPLDEWAKDMERRQKAYRESLDREEERKS